MNNNLLLLLLLSVFLFPFNVQIHSQGKFDSFKDSLDGSFDVSDWLLRKKGFLLVPSLITEPALGYGVGAAVVFFHSSYSEKSGPPSLTAVIGGGTENGTWAAGLLHMGFWKEDKIRYLGAIVRPYVNIKFYGSRKGGFLSNNPVLMNMDAWLFIQQLKLRVSNSNFFIGGRYVLYDTKNSFEIPINIPEFEGIKFNSTLSEMSLLIDYDSRDNIFTPTKGLFIQLATNYSDTWFGGDGLYGRVSPVFIGYTPVSKKFNLGFRFESSFSFGDIPFYAKPMVHLRGAPLMKYQNTHTSVIEAEIVWNLYKRWSIIGFSGLGTAFSSFDEFDKGKSVYNYGTGFRYLIARKFGMNMGLDFAKANDNFAFYIVFGSSWMR